jgi:VWFA-related protein
MPRRVLPDRRAVAHAAIVCLLACVPPLAHIPFARSPQPPAAATDTTPLDVTVLDREGRPPDILNLSDLTVMVDGTPRRVAWLRRVSRGPGARADAAARALRPAGPGTTFAAEPARTVLLIVDTATVVRGGEWEARAAISPLLDRLGLGDQLAVLSVPLAKGQLLTFSTDQPAAREAVAALVGQAARANAAAADPGWPRAVVGAPDREQAGAVERPSREEVPSLTAERNAELVDRESITPAGLESAASISQIMAGLSHAPNRKTVVFLSGGLPESAAPLVSQAVARAISARAVVHVLKLRGHAGADLTGMGTPLLERFARATGGAFVALDARPENQMERLARELAATFVVGIERNTADVPGRTTSVRVTTTRRDLVVRSPQAWPFEPLADGDVSPPPPLPPAPRPAAGAELLRPAAGDEAKDPEFLRAFGRLIDYVDSYVERSSVLVAEEDYHQAYSNAMRKVHLRSDMLIVKPERSLEWVAFRDVFEVDGFAVRDREDRLKRIFLDARPGADEQLGTIKAESARFNIGPVDRNVNLPYFTLKFLSAAHRDRFRYRLKGTPTVGGVKTWRVEFQEVVRPTIVRDRNDGDVPYDGWFLVDQATGAIVQTGMTTKRHDLEVSIVVKFTRDPQLGLWVPDEMAETYRVKHPRRTDRWVPDDIVRGTATYARFRRFQVKTDTSLTIPK